ncbi:MAG: HAD-IIIC family phosphatase [Rhizobiales bacterium]|nr:HAD-IIIC family phosphatase [Hyphomicrobiales bacterium]
MTPSGAPAPSPPGAATPAADPEVADPGAADPGAAAVALARALDAGGLTLAGLVSADRTARAAAPVEAPLRVYVLCGALASAMLAKAIRVALASLGVAADIREGGYDAYLIEALDPAGALYAFEPDLVVVALGWRDAPAPADLPARVEAIAGLWRAIHDRAGARVLHHLMEPPDHDLAGPAERRLEDSPRRCVERMNAALVEAAPGHVAFLDLGALAMRVGLSNWNSPRDYFVARQPFAPRWLPLYAHAFAAVWRGMAARERKALVVDLDGSLWGGVIGDDGLDGVVFGAGSAAGEAYAAFAAYLKALAARGVTLAVCSKNDPELPRRLFAERADMPLRLTDFAAFHCDWRDKATNIAEIARELNIGLDAIAFADDNPAECAGARAPAAGRRRRTVGRSVRPCRRARPRAAVLAPDADRRRRAPRRELRRAARGRGDETAGRHPRRASCGPGHARPVPFRPRRRRRAAGADAGAHQPVQSDDASLRRRRHRGADGARRRCGVRLRPQGSFRRSRRRLLARREAGRRDDDRRRLADELSRLLAHGRAVRRDEARRGGAPARRLAHRRPVRPDRAQRRRRGSVRATGLPLRGRGRLRAAARACRRLAADAFHRRSGAAGGRLVKAALQEAAAHEAAGRLTEAAAILAPLAQRHPEVAIVQFSYGRVAQRLGEGRAAEAALDRALALQPGHVGALRCLLALYEQDKRDADALAALDALLQALPADPGLRLRRALALARLARLDEALERLGELADDAPDFFPAIQQYAHLLDRAGRRAEAAAVFARAVALRPEDAGLWARLGAVRAADGDETGAKDALAQALRLDPAHAKAVEQLIALRQSAGESGALRAELAAALALRADAPHLWLALARLCERDDPPAAIAAYERALALQPGHRAAALGLSRALDAAGERDRAVAALEAALEAAPADIGLAHALGMLHARAAQGAPAERAFRHVLAREPGNFPASRQLAIAVRRQGRHAEALELFAQARLAARAALPPTFVDGLLAIETQLVPQQASRRRLEDGLLPERGGWETRLRHVWGRKVVDLVNAWAYFRREALAEIAAFATPVDWRVARRDGAEGRGAILVSGHVGVGHLGLALLAGSGLKHRIVGLTDEVLMAFDGCVHDVCGKDNHTALARLATFAGRQGGHVFVAGDGLVGGRGRVFRQRGAEVTLMLGPPTLAYAARAPAFYFACMFEGPKIAVALEPGPSLRPGETLHGWTDRWFDFFWPRLAADYDNGPENMISPIYNRLHGDAPG